MKSENTSIRLKRLLKERNLRQVDVLAKTRPYCEKFGIKLNKSDLSQYISGVSEPGSKKLTVLSLALGVNEPWLMGYDVPMTKELSIKAIQNSAEEIVYLYNKLDSEDKAEIRGTIKGMLKAEKYNIDYLEPVAAHNDAKIDKNQLELMNQDAQEL